MYISVLKGLIDTERHYQSTSKNTCYQITRFAKQKSNAREAVIIILLFNITNQ